VITERPVPNTDLNPTPLSQGAAVQWAALLAESIPDPTYTQTKAKSALLRWWEGLEASGLEEKLYRLPDAFCTVQFSTCIRPYLRPYERVAAALTNLRAGKLELLEAIKQVSETFAGSEANLKDWHGRRAVLGGFVRWFPGFEHPRSYLIGAVATGDTGLEGLRKKLLHYVSQPHLFLDSKTRDLFDAGFLEFKQGYCEFYERLHRENVEFLCSPSKMSLRVDSLALRNLEHLTALQFADKSSLQRAKELGAWLTGNRCELPVAGILEQSPVCYCNFNPAVSARISETVVELNASIQEGIQYFRSVLRRFQKLILQELRELQPGEEETRQVMVLLGYAPMLPLHSSTIAFLNCVAEKHPKEFRAYLRAFRP